MSFRKMLTDWYHTYFSEPDAAILAFLIAVSILIVWMFSSLLAPVFVALVIAYLLQWPVSFLERMKCPHVIAVLIIYLAFIALTIFAMVGLIPLLWQQLSNFVNQLPDMFSKGNALLQNLPDKYPGYVSSEQIQTFLDQAKSEFINIGQTILSLSLSSIPNVVMLIIYLIMVPMLIYFFLMDRDALIDCFSSYLPHRRSHLTSVWKEMYAQIGNYVRGRVVEIIIVSTACYVMFTLFGLSYAGLLATFVGISVIIPYIGTIIVTIPIVIVALLEWGLSLQFTYLLIGYLIILLLDGNVLSTLLFSRIIKLHPVAIILAVLIFGGLLGFWGVFFAIPLAAAVKTLVQSWPTRKSE